MFNNLAGAILAEVLYAFVGRRRGEAGRLQSPAGPSDHAEPHVAAA
jgi:hypothetical protein